MRVLCAGASIVALCLIAKPGHAEHGAAMPRVFLNPLNNFSYPGGLVFRCEDSKLDAIRTKMDGLIKDYGWDDSVVETVQTGGRLQYRLRNKTTNTLDLTKRPELKLKDDSYTYRPSGGSRKSRQLVSDKEILAALMTRGRSSTFQGEFCDFDQLTDHIGMRKEAARLAVRCNVQFPEEGARNNPAFWTPDVMVRPGKSATDAVADAFTGSYLYKLGCTAACRRIWVGSVMEYLKQTAEGRTYIERVAGRDPLVGADPQSVPSGVIDGKYLTRHEGVPDDNWIPGDWGYIRNNDESSRRVSGQEGRNLIYIGGGLFARYYDPRGKNPYTLDSAIYAVEGWGRHRVRATVSDRRDFAKCFPETVSESTSEPSGARRELHVAETEHAVESPPIERRTRPNLPPPADSRPSELRRIPYFFSGESFALNLGGISKEVAAAALEKAKKAVQKRAPSTQFVDVGEEIPGAEVLVLPAMLGDPKTEPFKIMREKRTGKRDLVVAALNTKKHWTPEEVTSFLTRALEEAAEIKPSSSSQTAGRSRNSGLSDLGPLPAGFQPLRIAPGDF